MFRLFTNIQLFILSIDSKGYLEYVLRLNILFLSIHVHIYIVPLVNLVYTGNQSFLFFSGLEKILIFQNL